MNKKIIFSLLMSLSLSSCELIIPSFNVQVSNPTDSEENSISENTSSEYENSVSENNSSSTTQNSSSSNTQDSSSSTQNSSSSTQNSSSSTQNSSSSNQTSSSTGSSSDTDSSSSNVDEGATTIELGEYGDYITSVDNKYKGQALYDKYTELTTEIESEANGIIKTKYQKGLSDFFDINNKVLINISISNSELRMINEYHNISNEESYRYCDVDITINDFIIHYEEVGIRLKGNTSRGYVINDNNSINLRHYKLRFNETFDDEFRSDVKSWTDEAAFAYREDRTFFGLEKLDIRWNRNEESTYIREYYAYEMYRNNGMLAPHTNPFNLTMTVDGSKQNAGIYLAVEPIDKDFLKRNLAKKYRDGDLYKLGWTSVGATFDSTSSNLFGVENQVSDGNRFKINKFPYDLKTNKKTSTHADIKNFINQINNTSASNFKSMLEKYTNYEMLMKYFAISYLLSDPDDLRGNFNNTYVYFIPATETTNALAIFIPTDHDRVLGSSGGTNPQELKHGTKVDPFAKKTGYSENNMPLYKKSILTSSNTEIRNDYLNAIKDAIDSNFMNIDNFKTYYNKAKSHYGNSVNLGSKITNRKVSFNLSENNDPSNNSNLSIDVYFKEKLKTVSNYVEVEIPSDNNSSTPVDPSDYDIVFHYYSSDINYNDLTLWTWAWKDTGSGQESNWSGTDEYGAYFLMNSANYENINRIGIIVKIGNFAWQTKSTYFNKDEFLTDENGKIHIYSKNDSNNNLLLYTTIQEALA